MTWQTVDYMTRILSGGIENPVLVDQYLPGIELEVDVISDGKDVLIPGIMEHIERAGVHSGDSIAVYPPYNLSDRFRNMGERVKQSRTVRKSRIMVHRITLPRGHGVPLYDVGLYLWRGIYNGNLWRASKEK